MTDWQSSATLEMLQLRARLLQKMRAFFHARGMLEVETPVLSQAAVTDPHIESFLTRDQRLNKTYYLHTSPEYAMKRLLAGGSGPVFQLCKVFRMGEAGRLHNPEFTMLEWYRPAFDHHQLMQEVEHFVRHMLEDSLILRPTQYFTYAEVFQRYAGLDVFAAGSQELQQVAKAHAIDVSGLDEAQTESWLDLLMTHVIEPRLPKDCLVFVYDYPAWQAALAKIRDGDPPVAERFELYFNGIELANGFHELNDAGEQRQRFQAECQKRSAAGLPLVPYDERLLAALQSGMPDCAGVALGFDRLLMLAAGKKDIAEVMAFDIARA